jgi:hypothetical protein
VTLTCGSPPVLANRAMPCQASSAGLAAFTMLIGISGGSTGRISVNNLSAKPGRTTGDPVRKMFYSHTELAPDAKHKEKWNEPWPAVLSPPRKK